MFPKCFKNNKHFLHTIPQSERKNYSGDRETALFNPIFHNGCSHLWDWGFFVPFLSCLASASFESVGLTSYTDSKMRLWKKERKGRNGRELELIPGEKERSDNDWAKLWIFFSSHSLSPFFPFSHFFTWLLITQSPEKGKGAQRRALNPFLKVLEAQCILVLHRITPWKFDQGLLERSHFSHILRL